MSDLQIALAALGVVVVGAVYAYNAWQERKLRQRLERAFEGQREDVLLKSAGPAAPRIEPRLGETATAAPAGAMTGRRVPGSDAVSADGADALIEFTAEIDAQQPIEGAALHELQAAIAVFGKPARVLGWEDSDQVWHVLGREAQGGGFRRLQVALQLVNRAGPVHAPQLNGFCDAIRAWALRHGFSVTMAEAADGIQAARDLDALCSEMDVAIGINVIAQPGSAFSGEQVASVAAAAGLHLESDGVFYCRDAGNSRLFCMENQEQEPFAEDALGAMQTSGLTLLLDVPHVADAAAALDEMVRVGGILAAELGGFLVDDNRVALQAGGVARIKTQLQEIHDSMLARDIAPGGARALRLFA